jgi:hypothetical protein
LAAGGVKIDMLSDKIETRDYMEWVYGSFDKIPVARPMVKRIPLHLRIAEDGRFCEIKQI